MGAMACGIIDAYYVIRSEINFLFSFLWGDKSRAGASNVALILTHTEAHELGWHLQLCGHV